MSKEDNKENGAQSVSRRDFLRKAGTYSAASLSGAAMLLSNPKPAQATTNVEWAEHFQKNYRLMTEEEKQEALDRLEKRYSEEFGKEAQSTAHPQWTASSSATHSISRNVLAAGAAQKRVLPKTISPGVMNSRLNGFVSSVWRKVSSPQKTGITPATRETMAFR